jgi:hypothetical protein
MRARCGDLPENECEARVAVAQRLALAANTAPHLVFPDTRPEDWLDCDQCRDCFKPAFALRSGESAQYSLAASNPKESDAAGRPLRFRWGFIGSSDDHRGQPGTGYKQIARTRMTDARGIQSERVESYIRPRVIGKADDPRRPQPVHREERSFSALLDVERVASFMYTGGLAAVHSSGRSREAIWEALKRREVYGTSGPRILLWFDLLNGPAGRSPMGSEVTLDETPRFEVRAAGSFVQKPGCPDEASGLSAEKLRSLCFGECYNPGDTRHPIVAIEVVRVRPRQNDGEDAGQLIEDPWRHFDCPPDPAGCRVTFDDPDYAASGRDAVYYVRALQEETPAINGAGARVERDASGEVVRAAPCNGNWRMPSGDDCLAPVQERAWSSPIFVDRSRLQRFERRARKGVEIGEAGANRFEDDLVTHASVLVHQDVAAPAHPAKRADGLRREEGSVFELVEQVIFLGGKAHSQTGDEELAHVDHALDGDLKKPLASPLGGDAPILLEGRRGDTAQLIDVAAHLVQLRENPVTVDHARPRPGKRDTCV